MRDLRCLLFIFVCVLGGLSANADEAPSLPQLTYQQEDDGVKILIDGELFTKYLFQSGTRPVLWPIVGPTGKPMTRAYPIDKSVPGEKQDHIHHRSLWIGYEGLNDIDFWHEDGQGRPYALGNVKHRELSKLESDGKTITLTATNEWRDQDGGTVCSDTRTFRFGAAQDSRLVDCLLKLEVTNGPLEIRDSKEGFFAVRVADTMRVNAKLGGRIVSSTGKRNKKAWGSRANWVDYQGPIADETVGIAILYHPKSYNPQPRWHVRPYGLFAVNPFGEIAFTDPHSDITKRPLRLTLAKGDSLLFRFLVILHRGNEDHAGIKYIYTRFASMRIDEF